MAYTTIDKSSLQFNTKLYSGTGGVQTISGVGFEPSWIWTKSRTNTGNHQVTDQVRGLTKYIRPNASNAEDTKTNAITAVNSDGFVLGADSSNDINASGQTYASWNWKAGTTSGITAGSQTITPTSYSINPTAGFGIYKWSRSGASTTDYFSHGLGATPKIAIQKRTDGVQDWYVNYTFVDGSMDYMNLNKVDDYQNGSTTVPTSTNYYPKSPETGDYITYLFTTIQGYSKFGTYDANNNADGPFIYTGFAPAFVIIKMWTGDDSWFMYDNKRSPFNVRGKYLVADGTGTDSNANAFDFLSNGFKVRTTASSFNGNGAKFIYMCFAEAPLVGSNNVPANAR